MKISRKELEKVTVFRLESYMNMRTNIKKKIEKTEVEVGDVIEWNDGENKIIAIITNITENDELDGITIKETRKLIEQIHPVQFQLEDNLKLLFKGKETAKSFKNIESELNLEE